METNGDVSDGYERFQIQQPQVRMNGHHLHPLDLRYAVRQSEDKEALITCYEVKVVSKPRRPPPPKPIFIALITLIACFCIGTPLSLVCTLPAYILADKAEVLKSNGEISKAKRFVALSIVLCVAASILGIATIAASFIVYNYIVYPTEFSS